MVMPPGRSFLASHFDIVLCPILKPSLHITATAAGWLSWLVFRHAFNRSITSPISLLVMVVYPGCRYEIDPSSFAPTRWTGRGGGEFSKRWSPANHWL